jgi:hypothetical protein
MIKPWEALNRDDDVVEAKTALDSIADVSNAGYRRGHHFIDDLNRIATVILLPLCVLLGGLSYYLFQQAQPPPDAALPPLASPAVGVLIPNEANAVVAPNAQRQAQGFLAAFARHGLNEVEANKHIYRFNYPFKSPSERAPGEEDTRQRILEQFQTWYDDGKRVFIITMSGAITAIREDFIEFAERQPENDRPVLVATVASAPGLASRRRGVFRHYIRSEDEAALLSAYVASLRSKARAVGPADTGRDGAEPQIAVFYVLDEYGKTAKDILLARHPTAMSYGIEGSNARAAVEKMLQDTGGGSNAVAVIIHYGGMVRILLEALLEADSPASSGRFEGSVLVASTFTEEQWRPCFITADVSACRPCQTGDASADTFGPHPALATCDQLRAREQAFAERIYTIAPNRPEGPAIERGVVYRFTYLTLDRAMACQEQRGAEAFWSCWRSVDPATQVQDWGKVEFLANGDSHVSLMLLDHTDWDTL